jgi:hypothetical protein
MKSTDLPSINPKFVVLIIGKRNADYNLLRKFMDFSWAKRDSRVFYVYGNGSLGIGNTNIESMYKFDNFKVKDNVNIHQISNINGRDIVCDSVMGWDEILPNTISAMQYLRSNFEFDFLVRTNQSTYWNLPKLQTILNTLPSAKLYAGQVMFGEEMNFVSGSGIILSGDLVDQIIANQDQIDSELIDDVSIGRFMRSVGVNPISIPRPSIFFHIKKCKFLSYTETLGSRQDLSFRDAVSSYSSIRCKDSGHKFLGKNFRRDIVIVLAIKLYLIWKCLTSVTKNSVK